MSLSLPLSEAYSISLKYDERKKTFEALHNLAPLLKIVALCLILVSPFLRWYPLIGTGICFICSALANYFKWRLVYTIRYTIKNGEFISEKLYEHTKSDIKQFFISDVVNVEMVPSEEICDKMLEAAFLLKNTQLLPVKIVAKDVEYAIIDKYMYSLIKNEVWK